VIVAHPGRDGIKAVYFSLLFLEGSVSSKLYVGNIPWTITEEDLKNHFSSVGTVKSASIIMDRDSGRSKGFGFVEMENAEQAITTLNGKDLGGRPLKVNEARPQVPRENKPYGTGGYGRN
jgi:cold-inducible RNA-binding protein